MSWHGLVMVMRNRHRGSTRKSEGHLRLKSKSRGWPVPSIHYPLMSMMMHASKTLQIDLWVKGDLSRVGIFEMTLKCPILISILSTYVWVNCKNLNVMTFFGHGDAKSSPRVRPLMDPIGTPSRVQSPKYCLPATKQNTLRWTFL